MSSTSPQPESPRKRSSRAQSYKMHGEYISDFLENSPLPFGINDQLLNRLIRKIRHNENYKKIGPAEITFMHDSDISSGEEISSEDDYDELGGNQDGASNSIESEEDNGIKHTKIWLMTGLHSKPTHPNQKNQGFTFSLPMGEGLRRLSGEPEDFKIPYNIFCPSNGSHKVLKWKSLKKNTWLNGQKKFHADKDSPPCTCQDSCDDDCLNRLLQFECNKDNCKFGVEDCGNRAFANLYAAMSKDHRHYALGYEVISAGNKGNGLRAIRSYSPHELIVEYTGEVIDQDEVERRLNEEYTSSGSHFYFLSLEKGYSIDSGAKGSVARFANHSCEPNSEMQKWYVNGEPRIGLFAGSRGIRPGQEITYDYNFDWFPDAEPQACFCGSAKCRGFIGKRTDPVFSQSSDDDEDDQNSNSSAIKQVSSQKGHAKTSITLNLKFQAFESSGLYYFKPKSSRMEAVFDSSMSPSVTPSIITKTEEESKHTISQPKRRTRNSSTMDQYKFVEVAQCLTPALQKLLQIDMAPPGFFDQTSKDMLLLNDSANSHLVRHNSTSRSTRSKRNRIVKTVSSSLKGDNNQVPPVIKSESIKIPKASGVISKLSTRSPKKKDIQIEAQHKTRGSKEASLTEPSKTNKEESARSQSQIKHRMKSGSHVKVALAEKASAKKQFNVTISLTKVKNKEKQAKRKRRSTVTEENYDINEKIDEAYDCERLDNEKPHHSPVSINKNISHRGVIYDKYQASRLKTTKGVIEKVEDSNKVSPLQAIDNTNQELIGYQNGYQNALEDTLKDQKESSVEEQGPSIPRLVDRFAFIDSDDDSLPLTIFSRRTSASTATAKSKSDSPTIVSRSSLSSQSASHKDSGKGNRKIEVSTLLTSEPTSRERDWHSEIATSEVDRSSPVSNEPALILSAAAINKHNILTSSKTPENHVKNDCGFNDPGSTSHWQSKNQSNFKFSPFKCFSYEPNKRYESRTLEELLKSHTTAMEITKPFTDVIQDDRNIIKRRKVSETPSTTKALLEIQTGFDSIDLSSPRINPLGSQLSDLRRNIVEIRDKDTKAVTDKKEQQLEKKSYLFDISHLPHRILRDIV